MGRWREAPDEVINANLTRMGEWERNNIILTGTSPANACLILMYVLTYRRFIRKGCIQGEFIMAFVPKKQAFNARIQAVTIGTGDRRIVIGGENVLPFYTFDAPIANKPRIAVEISDRGLEGIASDGIRDFYAGCETVADMAVRAQDMEGASAVCLHLESADPNGANTSVEDCVALAKSVAEAIEAPLLIMGCKNAEKDALIFEAIAEALKGRNVLLLSAREENYRDVGPAAVLECDQKLGAESSVDINLAKQLNVLLNQQGISDASVCMNLGSAAAGYGFEYLASTMDRVKAAALAQNDRQLQMPIVIPVSPETWGVKESMSPEEDAPEWGPLDERGIEMEVCTASACLVSGANLVIMRHPAAVAAVARFIDSLM